MTLPPSIQPVRIMVFGTFDVLHEGHKFFFRQARQLAKNPHLIVSVARSINVEKIKGAKPLYGEQERAAFVVQTGLADEVVLGATADYLNHIVKHKPAIIALGHDQTHYTENLQGKLAELGLVVKIVRLRPYKRHVYKSSVIKSNMP